MKLHNITLPIAIVIGAAILGISMYMIQANKQESIEKQKTQELQHEKELLIMQQQKEDEIRAMEELDKLNAKNAYDDCMDEAYNSYVATWNLACEDAGEEPMCPKLLRTTSDSIDEKRAQKEQRCLELYKAE